MSNAVLNPLKAIRRHCVECSGGSAKYIAYCTNDGVHATRCDLWPHRFGKRPATAAAIYGEKFLDAEQMPSGEISLDDLPMVGPIAKKPPTEEGRQRMRAANEAVARRRKTRI